MARQRHLKVTVEGKIYDVVVEDLTEDDEGTFYPSPAMTSVATRPAAAAARPATAPSSSVAPASAIDKVAPLGGVVVEISVNEGQDVKSGDQILVIEAMKMKQVVAAHRDGKVTKIHVSVGQAVDAGQTLMTIE